MKLIEADGKRILSDAGIAVPPSVFLSFDQIDVPTLSFPVYVKAQVLQGRRGQRGLVRRVSSVEEVRQVMNEMQRSLAGTPCTGFLCESETSHAEEWLVSVDIDGMNGCIRANVSSEGGMSVARARSVAVVDEGNLSSLECPSVVCDTLVRLVRAMRATDAVSIEINPLAIRADGTCVALDAKVELDDAAAFRHPERTAFTSIPETGRVSSERETAYAKLLEEAGHRGTLGRYVELDGDIALILSGGGASLVAIDALRLAGGRPANYVEMSGNPDPERVRLASRVVLSKPGIKAVWIAGSFANFTDIQATVNAVLSAITDLGLKLPVVIRRDGPNAVVAKLDAERWGAEHGVTVRFDQADTDVDTSAKAVVELSRV